MFVRFRRQGGRLQVSVVETRRVKGKVVAEHLGGLGSVDTDLSVGERLDFWNELPHRFEQIGKLIGPAERAKLEALLQARIPTPTAEERRSIGGEDEADSDPEFPLEPTDDDIQAMRKALGDDPTFMGLPESSKAAWFKEMLGIKWTAETYDDVAPQYHTAELVKSAHELQRAIRLIVDQIAKSDAHLVQALGEKRRRGLDPTPFHTAALVACPFLRKLLECSKAVEPRERLLPPQERPPKALGVLRSMVKLLERHGVQVGATGGDEGGPATRLMIRIHAYVTGGGVIGHDAIKNRLKRLREWQAHHQD
jgi:hypothetical protein